LQRDPAAYLRLSRRYMKKTGLRAAYMINWIDDQWWQEMDLPEFTTLLRRELPDCIGFLRGQGESAFERQYIGDGAPYVFCGEGLHRDSDVYSTFADFIQANPARPLFIYCLTNHTVSLGRIKAGLDRLPGNEVRLLRLDEFLLLADKAHRQGFIASDDFYPDRSGLRKLLVREARGQWPGARDRIRANAELARLSITEFRARTHEPDVEIILRRSATPPADVFAHHAVWDSMLLAKLALNMRGIYVNHKGKAVDDFVREYGTAAEAAVIRELWTLWLNWTTTRPTYDEACAFARRLELLANALNNEPTWTTQSL
jgi:hypothetical protein